MLLGGDFTGKNKNGNKIMLSAEVMLIKRSLAHILYPILPKYVQGFTCEF